MKQHKIKYQVKLKNVHRKWSIFHSTNVINYSKLLFTVWIQCDRFQTSITIGLSCIIRCCKLIWFDNRKKLTSGIFTVVNHKLSINFFITWTYMGTMKLIFCERRPCIQFIFFVYLFNLSRDFIKGVIVLKHFCLYKELYNWN